MSTADDELRARLRAKRQEQDDAAAEATRRKTAAAEATAAASQRFEELLHEAWDPLVEMVEAEGFKARWRRTDGANGPPSARFEVTINVGTSYVDVTQRGSSWHAEGMAMTGVSGAAKDRGTVDAVGMDATWLDRIARALIEDTLG